MGAYSSVFALSRLGPDVRATDRGVKPSVSAMGGVRLLGPCTEPPVSGCPGQGWVALAGGSLPAAGTALPKKPSWYGQPSSLPSVSRWSQVGREVCLL